MVILIYTPEVFKTITYPGVKRDFYEISNYGTIRQKYKKHRIKKPFIHKGYYRVALANEDTSKSQQTNRSVNRLVAYEFCEGYKEGYVVNHKNSDTLNNFYGNLEWITSKENSVHGVEYGNIPTGENSPHSKFTEAQVREICSFLEQGKSNIDIMNFYGYLNKRQNPQLYKLIHHIRRKNSWKQVSCEYSF